MKKRGKIVLLHFVGQMPLAGIAWQAVHYLLPLQKLGFDVWYVEDHGANPYDPRISSVVKRIKSSFVSLSRICKEAKRVKR